jgi:serine O-acetyltransferase
MMSMRVPRSPVAYLTQDASVNAPFAAAFCGTYRLGHWAHSKCGTAVSGKAGRLIYAFLNVLFGRVLGPGAQIDPRATFGPNLRLPHGANGIVIHGTVVAGHSTVVFHQVTMGVNQHSKGALCGPRLGDRVIIGAGAKLIGDIEIGDDAVIGAGAVVTRDVPAKAVAVGNPAIVRERTAVLPEHPSSSVFGHRRAHEGPNR